MDSATIIRYHLHRCRQNVGTPSNFTPSVVVVGKHTLEYLTADLGHLIG